MPLIQKPRMCVAPELTNAIPCAWFRCICADYVQTGLRRTKLGWRKAKPSGDIVFEPHFIIIICKQFGRARGRNNRTEEWEVPWTSRCFRTAPSVGPPWFGSPRLLPADCRGRCVCILFLLFQNASSCVPWARWQELVPCLRRNDFLCEALQ